MEQEKQLFSLSFEFKQLKINNPEIFGNLNALPINLLYAKKIMSDAIFIFENDEQKKAISDFIKAPVSLNQHIVDHIEDFIKVNYK